MSGTGTDPQRRGWTIGDDIVRLRQWASDQTYELLNGWRECFIGRGPACAIRLSDPKVSTHHARLMRDRDRWNLIDLGSKNGVHVDGVQQYTTRLEPCMVLALGDSTLMAESPRSIELRCFFSRLMGWGVERYADIDAALRDLRAAQLLRAPFVLRSEEPLVAVAQDLHGYLHEQNAPFVLCDPGRETHEASARGPLNVQDWREALVAARGGTLCLLNARPPRGLGELRAAVRNTPFAAVQLIVCAEPEEELCVESCGVIEIPALSSRLEREVRYVIVEYAREAARALGSPSTLPPEDRAWILAHCATSFAEVAKATHRLTALRIEGRVTPAAHRLGMSSPGLWKWLRAPSALPPLLCAADAGSSAPDGEEPSS